MSRQSKSHPALSYQYHLCFFSIAGQSQKDRTHNQSSLSLPFIYTNNSFFFLYILFTDPLISTSRGLSGFSSSRMFWGPPLTKASNYSPIFFFSLTYFFDLFLSLLYFWALFSNRGQPLILVFGLFFFFHEKTLDYLGYFFSILYCFCAL